MDIGDAQKFIEIGNAIAQNDDAFKVLQNVKVVEPNEPIDLGILRSQFGEVSKRHPGLSLIKILANKDETHPRITTVEKRGKFPSLHGKFAHRDDFPFWNLCGVADCDFWALWLDRDTVYSREENKRCLHEYSTVFSLTSKLVKQLISKPDCPSWIREQRDLGFFADGAPYFGAGHWLSLISNHVTSTTAMHFPLAGGTNESLSTAIVVRDVGLESILFLDSITKAEQVAETDSKPKAMSTSTMILLEAMRAADLAHVKRMREQNDANERALVQTGANELSKEITKSEAKKLLNVGDTKFKQMLRAGDHGLVSIPRTQRVRMLQSEYEKLVK